MSIAEMVKAELQKVENQYNGFINFVLDDAEDYKSENPNILIELLSFLTRHDVITASEVCGYMCYLIGLPYEEDGKWYRWDNEISEEEARKIVDEKYSE